MMNFHGCFSLNCIHATVDLINAKLEEYGWNEDFTNLFSQIRQMNRGTYLYIGGDKNHFSAVKDELFELLEYICQVDDRAFGIVYVHDDESRSPQLAEGYGVYVMKRGQVHYAPDPWLSPLTPTCRG